MQFSILSIEVDGTLRNPYVLAGFVIWTIQISIATAIFFHNLWGRRMSVYKPGVVSVAFLIASYFVGFVACRFVSTLLYMVSSPKITSVGYWGKAPFWVPPLVAAFVSLTYEIVRKRIHDGVRDGEQLAACDGPPGGP